MIDFGKWHRPAGAGPRDVSARGGAGGRQVAAVLVLCAIAGSACGKKGPPLPPLVSLPAAVENFTARRVGSEVVFQFTVPVSNTDRSRPADLVQVEIYGHTGRLARPADYLRDGTLVGTVRIRRPVSNEAGKAVVPVTEPGVDQGAVAVLSETLTPAALTAPAVTPAPSGAPAASPVPAGARGLRGGLPPVPAGAEDKGVAAAPAPPGRFYVAVGVNRRGGRGALSTAVGVPIAPSPVPPTALRVTYGPDRVSLAWLAGDQRPEGSITEGPVATDETAAPAPPAFNVYEVERASGAAVPGGGTPRPALAPLNASPLAALSFEDARIEFGKERCYAVRTVLAVADLSAESEPSPVACVTPVDTFPPAAPRSLAGVSSESAVNLIWEPNTEKDLGGYLVLRGEAPGEKLAAVTPAPIHETTYHDTAVRPGVTYVYAVVAVDTASPPNISEQSNRVEETVR